MMIGAIIGDIVGSRFEWQNHRSKEFDLFHKNCRFTDDTVMTIAVAKAILEADGKLHQLPEEAVKWMQKIGKFYPNCDYGGFFGYWLSMEEPYPYYSFGNGAAMRVSACGSAANSLAEAKALSHAVTAVTHDHPEGLKGAEAIAVAIYMAKNACPMEEIFQTIEREYYALDFTLDEIRPSYYFNATCQGSVPQALKAFFESTDFEDALRNAISIGGDSDTIADITCAVAGAYYGVPKNIREMALSFLNFHLVSILLEFEEKYGL